MAVSKPSNAAIASTASLVFDVTGIGPERSALYARLANAGIARGYNLDKTIQTALVILDYPSLKSPVERIDELTMKQLRSVVKSIEEANAYEGIG